jgi:hypothetical protein
MYREKISATMNLFVKKTFEKTSLKYTLFVKRNFFINEEKKQDRSELV